MFFKIRYLLVFLIIFILFFGFFIYINRLSFTEPESIHNKDQYKIDLNLDTNLDYNILFCKKDNCLNKLNNLFKNSKDFVNCSIYDIDSDSLVSTLLSLDSNLLFTVDLKRSSSRDSKIGDLLYNKISVFRNNDYSNLMHNKFCIIDNNYFIIGSANFTYSGLNLNNNNILIFKNNVLSKNINTLFSKNKDQNKIRILDNKNYIFNIKDSNNNFYNFYFIKPYNQSTENIQQKISLVLLNAKSKINCMHFMFTSFIFYNSILESSAKEKNIILESKYRNSSIFYKYNKKEDLNILLDNNKYNMHNKFCIVDNKYLITGSANFTNSAFFKNYESILITDNKDIIKEYSLYFKDNYNTS